MTYRAAVGAVDKALKGLGDAVYFKKLEPAEAVRRLKRAASIIATGK